MRRISYLLGIPMVLVTLLACETSTDLESVSLAGTWDGVGELNALASGMKLILTEGENGSIGGTWTRAGSSNSVTGTRLNGGVQLTLAGFQGATRTFEGRLTDAFRLAGSLDLDNLDGDAVFRRTSFD